jgi:hypothetical protein
MAESKSAALPLGYAPSRRVSVCADAGSIGARTIAGRPRPINAAVARLWSILVAIFA